MLQRAVVEGTHDGRRQQVEGDDDVGNPVASSHFAISSATISGLSCRAVAPVSQVACRAMRYSGMFGSSMPTRRPGPAPRSCSAAANRRRLLGQLAKAKPVPVEGAGRMLREAAGGGFEQRADGHTRIGQ